MHIFLCFCGFSWDTQCYVELLDLRGYRLSGRSSGITLFPLPSRIGEVKNDLLAMTGQQPEGSPSVSFSCCLNFPARMDHTWISEPGTTILQVAFAEDFIRVSGKEAMTSTK